MRFEAFYQRLSKEQYPVFSCRDLSAFFPNEKMATLKQGLSRWKKNKFVSSLKRDLYELTFPKPQNLSDLYLANKIYSPSYASLETALSHYSMIPEVSISVLSVTAKPTRRFKNSHGLFVYRSVQPKAFCGYGIENHGGFDVLIAEPEKALADFLYFNSSGAFKADLKELRLDMKKVAGLNKKKFDHYGRIYGIDVLGMLYAYL